MVDKLGLGSETKELKLGSSFTNKGLAFHTFRYDFKPASVDTTKMATVDVLPNNEVTVTVPHCDGAGTANTVFRGPKKPYTKECVLVIDHSTGEITLERLSQTLQLKKTRAVGSSKSARAMSPVPDHKKNSPLHSKTSPCSLSPPAAMSPVYRNPPEQPLVRSSPKHSFAPASSWANKQKNSFSPQTTQQQQQSRHLSSMPIINLDDSELSHPPQPQQQQHIPPQDMNDMLGVISDSSSGSDSSSNSSDTDDSDAEADSRLVSMLSTNGDESPPPPLAPARRETQGHGQAQQHLSMPSLLLSEDLQLSESGSDSD